MSYNDHISQVLITNMQNDIFGVSRDELIREDSQFADKISSKLSFILNDKKIDQINSLKLDDYFFYCFYERSLFRFKNQLIFILTRNVSDFENKFSCQGLYLPFVEEKITGFRIKKSDISSLYPNLTPNILKEIVIFTPNLTGCSLYILFSKTHLYFIHSNLRAHSKADVNLLQSDLFVEKIARSFNCYKFKKIDKNIYRKNCYKSQHDILSTFACFVINLFANDHSYIFYQTMNSQTQAILSGGSI